MPVRLTPPIRDALTRGRPVVGLESSVFAQGLPAPHNAEAARLVDAAVRGAGAEPGVTAVVQGTPTIGVEPDELKRLMSGIVEKASARDLAPAIAAGRDAATTVAAALTLCRAAGIQVFATGGIGGVHRDDPNDESADLLELSRTCMVVVCAGAKSILDLPATVERLETLGVTVVGYQTGEFPGFHVASTGIELTCRVDSPEEVAGIFRAQRRLGHPGAVLLVQPPPAEVALEPDVTQAAIRDALASARARGVRGAALTPFLLEHMNRLTDGRTLTVNLALLESNARLAGQVAGCLTRKIGA